MIKLFAEINLQNVFILLIVMYFDESLFLAFLSIHFDWIY